MNWVSCWCPVGVLLVHWPLVIFGPHNDNGRSSPVTPRRNALCCEPPEAFRVPSQFQTFIYEYPGGNQMPLESGCDCMGAGWPAYDSRQTQVASSFLPLPHRFLGPSILCPMYIGSYFGEGKDARASGSPITSTCYRDWEWVELYLHPKRFCGVVLRNKHNFTILTTSHMSCYIFILYYIILYYKILY
jgi:hypothetical protein